MLGLADHEGLEAEDTAYLLGGVRVKSVSGTGSSYLALEKVAGISLA